VHRRESRGEVGVALVRDQDDGPRLGDRHVGAADADGGVDELLAQRLPRVLLDRLDRRLRAEYVGRVLLRQVNRRRDQVRRMRVRQLHHSLAQVGLDDLHAQRFQVRVQLDLLAGHGLDLGHHHAPAARAGAPGVPADLGDDVARLFSVLGEVDLAADRLQPLRELFDELGQSLEVGPSPPFQIGAALGEVEALEGRIAPGTEAGHGVDQRSLQVRVV